MVRLTSLRLLPGLLALALVSPAANATEPSLETARDAIRRGQWTLAARELEILLVASPPEEVEAEALYLRALLSRHRGDLDAALNDVRAVSRMGAPLDILDASQLLEGELLYESGRYAEAGSRLRSFVAGHRDHARREHAEWLWAEAMARADSCRSALSIYDRLIRTASDTRMAQQATSGRAWCRRRMGDEEGAFEDFVKASRGPDAESAARSRFEAGASAFRLGRQAQGLEWLQGRHGEIASPDAARLERLLGQGFFSLGRMDEALPHLERALQLSGREDRPAILYQLAWIHLSSGRHEEAGRLFAEITDTAAVSQPLRSAAHYGLGLALLRDERFSEAVGPLEKIRQSGERRWGAEALYALGYAYNRLGDYGRSQDALEELRSEFPETPLLDEATLVQGENLFHAAKYEEAIRAYRQRLARGEGDRADALFKLGVALFKVGRLGEAEQALGDLLLRYPQSPHRTDARFWFAEALYRQGKLTDARGAYETLRLSDPKGTYAYEALYGLAWCDYSEGAYAEAAGRFGLLMEQVSGTEREADLLYRRGNCFYNLRQFSDAVEDYDRLLTRYPESPLAEKALYQKAWSLYRADRFGEAISAFDEMEVRYPASDLLPEAIHWGAYGLFREGRYEEAAGRFGRVAAMGSAPDSLRIQARLRMAESYFNAKDFNRAATLYEALAATTSPPEIREVAYAGWLRSLESAGRASDAEKAAGRMSEAFPDNETSGEALYRIGVRHMEAGQWRDGIRSLRSYLKIGTPATYVVDANRRCAEASLKLGEKLRAAEYYRNAAHHGDREDGIEYRFEAGRLLYELGKYAPAEEEFERVIRLNPESQTRFLALYNLGLCLKETGKIDDALGKFVEVGTNDQIAEALRADALLEAGLIERDRGHLEEAMRHLGQAGECGRGASGAEAQYWRAEIDFEGERYDDAIAALKKLLKRYPEEGEWGLSARYRLAACFERLNRWVEAREQYQLIVGQSNDETWTADARKRLEWIEENSWVFEEKPTGDPSRWEG